MTTAALREFGSEWDAFGFAAAWACLEDDFVAGPELDPSEAPPELDPSEAPPGPGCPRWAKGPSVAGGELEELEELDPLPGLSAVR